MKVAASTIYRDLKVFTTRNSRFVCHGVQCCPLPAACLQDKRVTVLSLLDLMTWFNTLMHGRKMM